MGSILYFGAEKTVNHVRKDVALIPLSVGIEILTLFYIIPAMNGWAF
jgi:hypothetical protein